MKQLCIKIAISFFKETSVENVRCSDDQTPVAQEHRSSRHSLRVICLQGKPWKSTNLGTEARSGFVSLQPNSARPGHDGSCSNGGYDLVLNASDKKRIYLEKSALSHADVNFSVK